MALFPKVGNLFKRLKDKWPLVTRARLNSEIFETTAQFEQMRRTLSIKELDVWMLEAQIEALLNERKASKSAEAGTPPVQRKPAPRKGKRVQGRRTQKNGKGRRGKLA